MSTICCMLHLFGKRLGQKGSTLYTGGFCACAAGGAASTPKKESAIATTEVLVHLALSNVYSFPSPLIPLCSLWFFSASSVLNSEKLNTEATKNHREPQSSRAATKNVRAMQTFRRLVLQTLFPHSFPSLQSCPGGYSCGCGRAFPSPFFRTNF